MKLLAAILAVVLPTASPSAPPRELPTIVTVISSPYCNSLGNHFNGALMPMLANDRVLDATSVQLDDLNTVFHQTDFVERFLHIRDAVGRQQTILNDSLAGIARNIKALRDGARLSSDAKATAQIVQAADTLQTAYDHQRQLAIDLQTMHFAMMRYNIAYANPALGGFSQREMTEPAAMRDVKSYLHFDRQRYVVSLSEDQAVDLAYAAAQTYCVPKK